MSISGEGGRPPFGPGAHAQQDSREDHSGHAPARRPIDRLRESSAPGQASLGQADQSRGGANADNPFTAPAAGGPLPGLAGFGRMAGVTPASQPPQDFEPNRPGPRVLTRDLSAASGQQRHQAQYRRQHENDRDGDAGSADEDAAFEAEDATGVGQADDADDLASGLPPELRRYLNANDDGDEDREVEADPQAGEERFDPGEHRPDLAAAFTGFDDSLGEGEEATSAHAFDSLDEALDEDEAEHASANHGAFEPLELGREYLTDDASATYADDATDHDASLQADSPSDVAFDMHDSGHDGRHRGLHEAQLGDLHDDFDDELPEGVDDGLHDAERAGRGLQAFEARYDQHPEIPIGAFPATGEEPFEQAMFPEADSDADFLDRGGPGAPGHAHPPRRGRKMLMVGCGLVGALALGGALAFAYKTGGDSMAGTGQPPIIQADAEPVRTAPADPGGREFPNRNKEVYERLQGEERVQEERLLPRQEEVAQRLPVQTGAIGGDGRPASDQVAAAPADTPQAAPRRVRTFVVRPDGSVVQPSEVESPQPARTAARDQVAVPGMSVVMPGDRQQGAAPAPSQERLPQEPLPQLQPLTQQQQAMPAQPAAPPAQAAEPRQAQQPQPEQRVAALPPAETGSIQPPTRRPDPPPRTATRQPASAAPGGSGGFVVQVAAHRSQTEALAAFADLQQRYPNQLRNYRPIIERADLRERGIFYRLRVGPMETRQMAGNLCEQLKSAGLQSCLVYAQ